jgi:dipeptidyl aminopeptidase/acylaminoacyl peptidase
VWRIATWDVTSGREVASFEVGDVESSPLQVSLAGRDVIVNFDDRIVRYSLDGSSARELYRDARDGGSMIEARASPDGRYVAVTEFVHEWCPQIEERCRDPRDVTRVFVIDLEMGAEVLSVSPTDPAFDGMIGVPANITWRDDGAGFLVWVSPQSEMPAHVVTVMLDGTLTPHPYPVYRVYVAPNGRYAIADDFQTCDLSLAVERHEASIFDLDSGVVLTALTENESNIALSEWSPDGQEFLVRMATLEPAPAPSECFVEDESTAEWWIMRASGEPPIAVSGLREARRRWYGGQLIVYRCDGVETDDAYCRAANGSDSGEFDVVYKGRVITSARYQEFEIIGYVD